MIKQYVNNVANCVRCGLLRQFAWALDSLQAHTLPLLSSYCTEFDYVKDCTILTQSI